MTVNKKKYEKPLVAVYRMGMVQTLMTSTELPDGPGQGGELAPNMIMYENDF